MAKKTAEKTTAKTAEKAPKAAAKTAAKNETVKVVQNSISFGAWVKDVARARGEQGVLVNALRTDTRIRETTTLKKAEELHGTSPHFAVLASRYALYGKRGSQAGMRSRAAA